MTDYTKQAQMMAEQFARNFHGPTYSLDDAAFSIDEAARLIAQSKIERQHILRTIAAQEQSQEALDQQRENVSLLPDREAERIQRDWIKDAEASALRYCESVNKGATPRSTQGVDSSITDGVISWIAKKRRQNFWPKKAE